jgi:hypothetical protein
MCAVLTVSHCDGPQRLRCALDMCSWQEKTVIDSGCLPAGAPVPYRDLGVLARGSTTYYGPSIQGV